MQKMVKENEISADWCKDICLQLATFNKVFMIRNGKGLVQNIVLSGTDEDIAVCVKNEAMFFAANGLMLNEEICTDKNNTTSPQTYYLENDNDLTRQPGSLYFFKKCKAKDCNRFDVTGLYKSMMFDFTELINELGFSGLENDMLQGDIGAKINITLENMSLEQFVNNTLIHHYMKYDDDTYRPETDFTWIDNETENIKKTDTEKTNEHREHSDSLKLTQPSTNKQLNEQHIGLKEHSINNNKQTLKTELKPETNTETKSESKTEVETKTESETEQQYVPEPVEKKVKMPYQVKDILTKEECEKNEKLLKDLRKRYENVIEHITKTHNPQLIMLKNKMCDELKDNHFCTQWSKVYWDEISQDNSTELYKLLYELDMAINEFQKQVVHQVVKLGCPFCAHEWDEDITFLEPGPHFVECPSCFTERGFEKRIIN